MVIYSKVAKTVLLACGLARAVKEKTRCIEWVCIYAYIHPHVYNDINVLFREAPVQVPHWEQGFADSRRGECVLSFTVDRASPCADTSQMQFAGVVHVGVELDQHSLLQDDMHMVIIGRQAIPSNQKLEDGVTAYTLDLE